MQGIQMEVAKNQKMKEYVTRNPLEKEIPRRL
jgi:hypothetical protein